MQGGNCGELSTNPFTVCPWNGGRCSQGGYFGVEMGALPERTNRRDSFLRDTENVGEMRQEAERGRQTDKKRLRGELESDAERIS